MKKNIRKIQKTSNNKGFTLVELIIIIAITAILVAVVVPNFLGYLDKARKVRDMEMARVLGTALERCIAIDPEVTGEWEIISDKNNVKSKNKKGKNVSHSHVEYSVTDYEGKSYKLTNVFEFTVTYKGEIEPDNKGWHCELHYREGVLRNARTQVTAPGDDILWDAFVEEIASVDIKIMYQKYRMKQFKVSKNLDNGRVEVWVCPVPEGTDGEGITNGWLYYRLYPDPDPRYMSKQLPVATNADKKDGKGGQKPTTFY